MRIQATMCAALALASGVLLGPAPAVRAQDGLTVAALRAAYQREAVSEQRYRAYAARAASEGHADAAVLFDALAAAEGVHGRLFARALEEMGVTPAAAAEPVALRSTPENLAAAIDGELGERGTAYPRFMTYARAECLYEALAAFRYARGAESSHAGQLAELCEHLGEPSLARAWYVCPGCGSVQPARAPHACLCGTPSARWLAFESAADVPQPEPMVARR